MRRSSMKCWAAVALLGLVGCVDPKCPAGWTREGDKCRRPDAGRVDGSVDPSQASDASGFQPVDGLVRGGDAAVEGSQLDARSTHEELDDDEAATDQSSADDQTGDQPEAGSVDAGTITITPDANPSPTSDAASETPCEARDACVSACVASAEMCDQKDNDCDGAVDEDGVCKPACVKTAEICDWMDNDCDGEVDEEPPTWYRDCDNDGAAVLAGGIRSCTRPEEPGCPSWLEKAPTVSDCNDGSPSYRPGIAPVLSTNAPNANEEKLYIGDMNCDGVVEKPTPWQYYDYDATTPKWIDSSIALCTSMSICAGGSDCYENGEQPGAPLGCGNTEILIHDNVTCSGKYVDARVACR